MQNLEIERPSKVKSWEELANMIFDLTLERQELEAKLEDAEKWRAYWFTRAEELKRELEDLHNENMPVLREADKMGENKKR